MIQSRYQLEAILTKLPRADRGGSVLDVLGWLDVLEDAGYSVECFAVDGQRVYRATAPKTGERMEVSTVPGAVTDWTAVRGVAQLWGCL